MKVDSKFVFPVYNVMGNIIGYKIEVKGGDKK